MRNIAVITSSRADYSHLFWPLRKLQAHEEVELHLIVMAAHLSAEFGHTIKQIKQDGFTISEQVECLLSSDSDVGMAKTIGVAILGLTEVLARSRPDIILIIADRYEMLAPAAVALALRIPIAHIEGGEISAGAIDDAVRNALTKMSHVHFVSTRTARQRVIAMGEESWRVHQVGAPSLDHLKRSTLLNQEEIETQLNLKLKKPLLLVSYHPVTLLRDTTSEAEALFAALVHRDEQIIFCFPNADSGSRELISEARSFCNENSNASMQVNLAPLTNWSLLSSADVIIGNSSSGIMESASLQLPAVNIGLRQQGRERAANIIDVPADARNIEAGIDQALDEKFKTSIKNIINPYGDGHASEKIVNVLSTVPLGEALLFKKNTLLHPEDST